MARTKEFDIDEAIDQALEVFWTHGYQQASLARLTEATGLHKGSLYGAFKSKENLFKLSLERYMQNTGSAFKNSGKSSKQYLQDFFTTKINCNQARRDKGCLLMNSCLELSNDKKNKKQLERLFAMVESNLQEAISSGIKNKEFSTSGSVEEATERLVALAFTIEEMGKLGKDKKFLTNISNGILKEFNISI